MAFTIHASNHQEWERLGLQAYPDLAGMVTKCNQGQDSDGAGYGEWYYVPEEALPGGDRVIYFGSWGRDHPPGASMYTHASVFSMDDPEDAAEYTLRVQGLQSQPEHDEQPEGDDQP